VCGLALRKADSDDTVKWPLPWSATRNDPAPAIFLTPSPLTSKGHQPDELSPLALPVNAVSCVRPISDIFQTKCGMVVVHRMTRGPVLTISLDNLVPLVASPVSDPFLDDCERERSDPGRADTPISRRWMTRNRSALV
jgi:hypothetical protein